MFAFFSHLCEISFADACKKRDLFTRQQQAEAFRDSYRTLPVHTTTLRNLGNFKSVLQGNGVVSRLPKITKARAFQLLRHGQHQVAVGMKEYMHQADFKGMATDGSIEGDPHLLFVGGIPRVEDADPFTLKAIDEETIRRVTNRYQSLHQRVEALYAGEGSLLYQSYLYTNLLQVAQVHRMARAFTQ